MTMEIEEATASAAKDNSSNSTKKKTYKVGDIVYFKGGAHYVSSWPGAKGTKQLLGKRKLPWDLIVPGMEKLILGI